VIDVAFTPSELRPADVAVVIDVLRAATPPVLGADAVVDGGDTVTV
jgi:hypothetical protein